MKFGLVSLLISFFLLFAFTYVVFFTSSDFFSLREKVYLVKISALEEKVVREIDKIGEQIQQTIQQDKNKDFINHILKYDFSLNRKNLLFKDPLLKHFQVYNHEKKLIYYNNEVVRSELSFEEDIFITEKYLAFNFRYIDKKEANLFFFYDLQSLLAKIVEDNPAVLEIKNAYDKSLLYRSTYVLDYGDEVTLRRKLVKLINEFIDKNLLFKKVYSSSEKKYLLLYKTNFLNLNLAIIYPSNRTDIPGISLIGFFLIFTMLVFSFVAVLNSLKVFNKYFRKKNSAASFFYKFSDLMSSFSRGSRFLMDKLSFLAVKNPKSTRKPLPINEEIIGLVNDIDGEAVIDAEVPAAKVSVAEAPLEKRFSEKAPVEEAPEEEAPVEEAPEEKKSQRKTQLISLSEIKKKILQSKSDLLKTPDREKISFLENLFDKRFKKIGLIFLFKEKLWMFKEYKNLTKESIDRFVMSQEDFIHTRYLLKNQMVALSKYNPQTSKYLRRNLSSEDFAHIDQVAIFPIKQGSEIAFIVFLAQ